MKNELLTALQPAFAKISEMGIRYSALPGHTLELADALNEQLSGKWRDLRGMEIVSFGISSVKANEEDEQMIKELQRNAAFMDPTRAAAHLVGSQGEAMKAAAANTGAGPAMAFMGMGMAGQAGGMNAQSLFQMGQQQQQMQQAAQPAPAPTVQGWTCSCGQSGIIGNFCPNCGSKKPAPKPAGDSWKCSCGATVSGKFCPECGSPKPVPADEGWKCTCGAVNKGKFCSECGAKKPAGVPQYKCDKCGWEPADPKNLPGFLADKYDVSVEKSHERADQRCQGTLDAALRSRVRGYDTCIQTGGSSGLQRGKVHYALMPVWMLNTKWHGKDFTFAVNGQTGKLVGDLPMSWGRFWGMFAGIAALLSIVGSIGATLLML